jgi:hypothetical protein
MILKEVCHIPCPKCGYDYAHYKTSTEAAALDYVFKQGCISAFWATCEGCQELFIIAIGEHKGRILIETVVSG